MGPAEEEHAAAVTLADELLPVYDVRTRHAITVAAPASAVWAALHRADFASAWYVRGLLMLRGLRRPTEARRLTLDRLIAGGFIALGERAGREIALGLIGRFWTPSGGRVRVTPGAFRAFASRGNANRDTRGLHGRGQSSTLPSLLAHRPALQRVDPPRDARRRRAGGRACEIHAPCIVSAHERAVLSDRRSAPDP
jgi:hypothetical protein